MKRGKKKILLFSLMVIGLLFFVLPAERISAQAQCEDEEFFPLPGLQASDDIEAAITNQWGDGAPPIKIFGRDAAIGQVVTAALNEYDEKYALRGFEDPLPVHNQCPGYGYFRDANMSIISRITLACGRVVVLIRHAGGRGYEPGSEGYVQIRNGWSIIDVLTNQGPDNSYSGFGLNINKSTGRIEWQGRGGCTACACLENDVKIAVVVEKTHYPSLYTSFSSTRTTTANIEASITTEWGSGAPPIKIFGRTSGIGQVETAVLNEYNQKNALRAFEDPLPTYSACPGYGYTRDADMSIISRVTLGQGRVLVLVRHGGARGGYPGSEGYVQLGNGWIIEKIISASIDTNSFGYGIKIDEQNGTIEWQGRTGCPGCACQENAAFVSVVVKKGSINPKIISITPDSGPVGTQVVISGSNFGASTGTVTFNGVNAAITSWADDQIQTSVPTGAATGNVVIHPADGKDSNGVLFTVIVINLPTVSTALVSSITQTSAICGGNVTSDGGASVTSRGVCWSKTANPTVSNSKTTDGSGTGSFTSNIAGLNPGTTYHVRAYAINSKGTGYGEDREFKTVNQVASLRVIYPNGGEKLMAGTNQTIAWSSNGNVGNVKIQLSSNNGKNWDIVASSIPNNGSYSWLVPNVVSKRCLIRISGASDDTPFDKSDGVFSISKSTPPQILLNRTQLVFGAMTSGQATPSQSLMIENGGGGTLNWTITNDTDWMTCTPSSGTGAGEVMVSVQPQQLPGGIYNGTITVSDSAATNLARTIPIIIKVYNTGQTSSPIGEFATPLDGSTVSSSIPVTGWVLDDIGVESVKIYREENGNLIYIGDAGFVEGARPDVEQAYPAYPMNYQAGWGYMLLTNFLPNGGNGTFKLHAKATDTEGHKVTLGTKTITCDNAHAVKPFGAIDSPQQGGDAYGISFRNQGWALTPRPNQIDKNGSTIKVWIDGLYQGNATYNIYREDIAGLFPGYANSNGAHGYFNFDTTGFSNGIHSICWTVEDNAGNSDGIGSRYFKIMNADAFSSREANLTCSIYDTLDTLDTYDNVAANDYTQLVLIKTGYKENSSLLPVFPGNDNNIIQIHIPELERIEAHLGSAIIEGYMQVGNELRPLPTGSTLDKVNGIFYWWPGPGFLGAYDFVFIAADSPGEKTQKKIQIIIDPLGAGK
ncbi:MAG: hypothetical protein MUF15_11775 [Acidobacteria bacterium]|jgi:hypothetical protein|nr:hypothetical protein [Acidobacteriota bacterium]